jgi:O-antigen ligase
MPVFLLFVFWWLAAFISEAWACNPTYSLLASPLLLLIIPALLPVLKQPRTYILAIGAGAVLHTAIQAITWFGLVRDERHAPMTVSGGLHWYPPFTALWSTCAFLLLLGLILNANSWKHRLVPLLLAIPLPFSLLLAGTRILYILIPLVIFILMIKLVLISTTRIQKQRAVVVCLGIIIVDICVMFAPWSIANQRLSYLVNEVSKSTSNSNSQTQEDLESKHFNQFENSVGMRFLWWKSGFEIWRKSPWIGHGNGTSKYQFAIHESEIPSKYGANVSGFIIADPHSSLLTTAMEQGLLGVIPLLLFTSFAFIRSWRYARAIPSLVGLSACWVTIIGFSFVHTVQFDNYGASLVVIFITFAICMVKDTASKPNCPLTFHAE